LNVARCEQVTELCGISIKADPRLVELNGFLIFFLNDFALDIFKKIWIDFDLKIKNQLKKTTKK
jgi:hypothetical protein